MNFVGIDLGSRSVKQVVLDAAGVVVSEHITDTLNFYKEFGQLSEGRFSLNLSRLNIHPDDVVVSTGYGKHQVIIEGVTRISEQKAHVLGAIHQTGLQDFVLVDIGGQDTKVIGVKAGQILDVHMNDKCGASSGRYLENMAQVLSVSLEELGLHSENPLEIATTCAIFGESEVLGRVFEGQPLPRILAGINLSVVRRVENQIRLFPSFPIILVGGVAKNAAINKILMREMNVDVIVPVSPQFNGAIGAAKINLPLL
jgi:predicted CoA-substrate-specific enzyme activase